MSCEQNQYLDAYLDGELPAEQVARIEQHLQVCAECAAELGQLRKLSAALSTFSAPALSGEALERLHEAVSRAWDVGVLRLARAISAVAASVVLCGTLYLTYSTSQRATAAPVWEQAAVGGVSTADAQTASATNTGDQQLAEWIVADLSHGNSSSAQ